MESDQEFFAADEAARTRLGVGRAKDARQSGVGRARHHRKGAKAAAPDGKAEPAPALNDWRCSKKESPAEGPGLIDFLDSAPS